jgi:hypothetical protein
MCDAFTFDFCCIEPFHVVWVVQRVTGQTGHELRTV